MFKDNALYSNINLYPQWLEMYNKFVYSHNMILQKWNLENDRFMIMTNQNWTTCNALLILTEFHGFVSY